MTGLGYPSMSVAIVTGSSGLIGSETSRFFHEQGLDVIGIDNNMRRYFFGEDGSVQWNTERLKRELPRFTPLDIDIRNQEAISQVFKKYGAKIRVVIHAAAQPSHDWAAREPITDFTINANGTLYLLEAARLHSPEAVFIFTSTNKVYGDTPNSLPLIEHRTRFEVDPTHPFAEHGIDESMSIDSAKHSLFGASKVAADILVQEYGRYFGMKTGVFRGGCLSGPAHLGAQLHGFLSYLVKCVVTEWKYVINGFGGKQVRDNIHSRDLVTAFWSFFQKPRSAAVYNIGGSRHSHCSVLEAIQLVEEIAGCRFAFDLSEQARNGDHIWYVSDVRKFQADYPEWRYQYTLAEMVAQIVDAVRREERDERG